MVETDVVNRIVQQFGGDRTRLLDMARAVHAELGHISEETVAALAKALDVPRVEVRDMVSFYAFFFREPHGTNVIYLCHAVVERMQGADDIARALEEATGTTFGASDPDADITLRYTSCIGLSDQAPSALVNGVPVTNLTVDDVPELVAALRGGRDITRLRQAQVGNDVRTAGQVIFAPTERGAAVRKAVTMTPDAIIEELNVARLRGRGGAGFPTAMKWKFCRQAKEDVHYVVCNADEGEPGTFKDRAILALQPNLVFGGMTVAARALGARKGILYLRAEYEYLLRDLESELDKRRHLGLLGDNICGCEGFDFDIRIQLGAGAYICGEESALIESLEGKRGAPRARPPFPVEHGYLGKPTSVNNVETLCCAARILVEGGAWFADIGTKDSTGTKLLSVSGDCTKPGVYELEYGLTVLQLLERVGAENAQAVQMGGPSGQCLARKDFARSISFEDLPTGGSVIIFGPERDLLEAMRQFTAFFAEESCGWCAPCRVGTTLLEKCLQKILDGKGTFSDLEALETLGETVKTMSRCGLGQTAANPILTTLRNFPMLYADRVRSDDGVMAFDLERAKEECCSVAGRAPATGEEPP
ncbi:MAG: NAD(P)H-dependent oxidoreductase subunit E [Candidatus Hydrogenedentes bacterium]|nr:NAD(P)H-dependent oxidoreductase subunit E [Candidatus Hydrogenedentota bacterium]